MVAIHIPIFVINLDRSPDRLQSVTARLDKFGLTFERIPAIDGSTLSAEEQAKLCPKRFWRNYLSGSEIACFASHLKAIQCVVDREIPRALILEDDAVFDDDFAIWANSACPFPEGTDLLKLEGFDTKPGIHITMARYANRDITFSYRPSGGAAAYIITLAGAKKALQKLKSARGQIDHELFAYWNTGLHVYEVLPFPAKQDELGSTIDHRCPERTPLLRISRYLLKSSFRVKRLYFVTRHYGLNFLFLVLRQAVLRDLREKTLSILNAQSLRLKFTKQF